MGVRKAVTNKMAAAYRRGSRLEKTAILDQLPDKRQTFLFSATLPDEIRKTAQSYLREPKNIDISRDELTVEGISNIYYETDATGANGIFSTLSYMRLSNFTHTSQTPWQFCSNRNAPVSGFAGLQGMSWHKGYKRPCVFLDGHVKNLASAQYCVGGGNNLYSNSQSLLTGAYSSWQLVTGSGSPAHQAGDYWIDEY